MKHYIGEIIDEMKIIDILPNKSRPSKPYYLLQCLKCNRIRKVGYTFVETRKRTFHKYCLVDIDKTIYENKRFLEAYYSLDLNLLKNANIEGFVDFYDMFYESYMKDIKKYPNRRFYLKKINGKYQYVVDDSHQYFVGEIIDDIIIKEIIPPPSLYGKKTFRVKCLKCNNEMIFHRSQLHDRISTKHKSCKMKIKDRIKKDIHFKNFHKIWQGLRARTKNKNIDSYKWYGEKGINSDEFALFIDFYNLMYQSYLDAIKRWPNETISIDRIDVNGNYCKNNCRWIPVELQEGNKSTNKWILAQLDNKRIITKNISCFAEKFNLRRRLIYSKLEHNSSKDVNGWTFEYIDINNYKNIPYLNDINAIIDITDINNPININPI